MTTLEKVEALVGRLARIDPAQLAPEIRDLLVNLQMLRGLAGMAGLKLPSNLLDLVLPADPLEADTLVDKLIALLLELRGDDLPPFDANRYGESFLAELLGPGPAALPPAVDDLST